MLVLQRSKFNASALSAFVFSCASPFPGNAALAKPVSARKYLQPAKHNCL